MEVQDRKRQIVVVGERRALGRSRSSGSGVAARTNADPVTTVDVGAGDAPTRHLC